MSGGPLHSLSFPSRSVCVRVGECDSPSKRPPCESVVVWSLVAAVPRTLRQLVSESATSEMA